jgi:hypothetical protein
MRVPESLVNECLFGRKPGMNFSLFPLSRRRDGSYIDTVGRLTGPIP